MSVRKRYRRVKSVYERLNDHRAAPFVKMGLGFALIAALPFLIEVSILGYRFSSWVTLSMLTLTLIWAFTSQAFNIMSGYTGKFSFGHAAYFGIGAYATQYLLVDFTINPWIGMLVGGVIAVLYGGFMGFLTLRYDVKGHYFVLVTLAFAELARFVALNSSELNGALGFYRPFANSYADGPGLVAFQFRDVLPYYYLIFAFLVLITLIAWAIKHSQIGLYLFAIREDEDAAKSIGISTFRYNMFAIATSVFFTAWAGAFWSMYFDTIRPDPVFGLFRNVDILLPAVVGGFGTVAGPILGSFFVTPVSEFLRSNVEGVNGLVAAIYGIVLITIALYSPNGVLYWPSQLVDILGWEVQSIEQEGTPGDEVDGSNADAED
jgi:branched-chain amino acid transport system permease protein